MQNDEGKKYMEDILFSIDRVNFHIQNIHSLSEYTRSWTIYDAVERRIAIIGEAVSQIDKIDSTIIITDKRKIIGLRNILTHDYDIVTADIIWKIIHENLPVLKEEITNLLSK
jgi:uncharacterized protein with HEPN domain